MSTPNFSELLKINQYLAQIESLSGQVKDLQIQLEETESRLAKEMATEKYRLTQTLVQKKVLEKINQELQELRQEEFSLSMSLRGKLSQAIEKYMQGGSFAGFVSSLVQSLEKQGQQVTLVVSPELKNYAGKHFGETAKEPGRLRVRAGDKTYVLDPEKIRDQLQKRLLIQVLAR
jgi:hypothetical protein